MDINPIIVRQEIGDTVITLSEWINPSNNQVINREFSTVTEMPEGIEVFPMYHDSLIEAVEHACDQSPKHFNVWRVVEMMANKAMLAHDRRGITS